MSLNSGTSMRKSVMSKVGIELCKHKQLGKMMLRNDTPIKPIDKKKRKIKNKMARKSRKLNR